MQKEIEAIQERALRFIFNDKTNTYRLTMNQLVNVLLAIDKAQTVLQRICTLDQTITSIPFFDQRGWQIIISQLQLTCYTIFVSIFWDRITYLGIDSVKSTI